MILEEVTLNIGVAELVRWIERHRHTRSVVRAVHESCRCEAMCSQPGICRRCVVRSVAQCALCYVPAAFFNRHHSRWIFHFAFSSIRIQVGENLLRFGHATVTGELGPIQVEGHQSDILPTKFPHAIG